MKSTKLMAGIAVALVLAMAELAGAQATTQPSGQPSVPTTRPSNSKALPADQMLSQMLKPAGGAAAKPLQPTADAPVTDAKSGSGAVAPTAPAQAVVREGTFIVDRTGRLTRSADGQQLEFTFDADGRAMRDPPVVLLPNLKLMAMENAVTAGSRDLRFRITGMVTEYKGRNYVLLEKVVVVPDATQQF